MATHMENIGMQVTLRLIGMFALAFVLAQPAFSAPKKGMVSAGHAEMLVQSCFACHGPKGASAAPPLPIIGGQSISYMSSALMAFKEGKRPATIMTRLMKAYSETEINAIAQYLAAQPFVRAEQSTDGAKVSAGKAAYERACKDCHLNGGRESSDPDYPILAGQWLPYLQMSIADIVSRRRAVDDRFLAALSKLSGDEIDAVLHYFAAQR